MADIPSRVTTTGANGLFRFSSVSPGAYVLKASAPGYRARRTSIRIEPNPSGSASNPAS
jgi:protocatechuate 3,4-dioxygenase beta subunit